jgi:endogenous inhibitor of DNA gyrase (YacG/DUF329 family)
MAKVSELNTAKSSKTFPMKQCTVCNKDWEPENRYQAARKAACSKECTAVLIGRARLGKKASTNNRITIVCPVCHTVFERAPSHVLRVSIPVCSKKCNGHYRGKQWGASRRLSSASKEQNLMADATQSATVRK